MNNPFEILLEPSEKKGVHTSPMKLNEVSGRYRLGPPTRPPIKHDNGFLDFFPKRSPTASDRLQFARWAAMLEGSEALCSSVTRNMVPLCQGEDLSDANAAYRHFLYGKARIEQSIMNATCTTTSTVERSCLISSTIFSGMWRSSAATDRNFL